MTLRHGATLALAWWAVATAGAAADMDLTATEIYAGACASCHGIDGRGAPGGLWW